jgi:hypothetical protein
MIFFSFFEVTYGPDYTETIDEPEIEPVLRKLDQNVESVYSYLPSGSLLLVLTGNGNTSLVKRFDPSSTFY